MTTFFLDQNPYCNKERPATINLRRFGAPQVAVGKGDMKLALKSRYYVCGFVVYICCVAGFYRFLL